MSKASLELKSVELPYGKIVYQSKNGQGISSETAELVRIILSLEQLNNLRVLELGSGSGIISLMLKHYNPSWGITGIEIQGHLVEISHKNSGLTEEVIDFREEDLRKYTSKVKYDLIIMNPPYFKVTKGRISPNTERAIARHELMCELKDIISAFQRNLANRGKAYFLYLENREGELMEAARAKNMKLDRIGEISSLKKIRVRIYRIKLNDRI